MTCPIHCLNCPQPLYTAESIARAVMNREMTTDTAALLCRTYSIGVREYAIALAVVAAARTNPPKGREP